MKSCIKTIVSLTVLGWLTAAITLVAASEEASKLPPVSAHKGVTYAKDIKPIFDKSCVRCHGAEKPKAGLRLDGLEAVLKGTPQRKVVKPGDSAQSPIVHSTALVGDQDRWMPPPGNRAGIAALTKDQVSLLRAWIDQGAK